MILHTEPKPRPFDWVADVIVPFLVCVAIWVALAEVGVAVFAVVHG